MQRMPHGPTMYWNTFQLLAIFSTRRVNWYKIGDLLIHWGWVTHICISKLTTIGWDNNWSHQAIIWTNVGTVLIGPLGINFSEILIKICSFSFKTRQHSTQSVRNMPPPSPRHLLPHFLQIMPRNANYDQFQPKGHHNEENPQSMTKMPGNPKFYLFH